MKKIVLFASASQMSVQAQAAIVGVTGQSVQSTTTVVEEDGVLSTDGNGRYVQNGFDEQKGIFLGSALNVMLEYEAQLETSTLKAILSF